MCQAVSDHWQIAVHPPHILGDSTILTEARRWVTRRGRPLPDGVSGRWCELQATGLVQGAPAAVSVAFCRGKIETGHAIHLRAGQSAPSELTRWIGFGHVPPDADGIVVATLGNLPAGFEPSVKFSPVSRERAMLRLFARHGIALLKTMALNREALRNETWKGLLAQLSASLSAPNGYSDWVRLFDTWQVDSMALQDSGRRSIKALVIHTSRTSKQALRATLASIAAQHRPIPCVAVSGGGDAIAAIASLDADYVAILQAGELLPRHASWLIERQLSASSWPRMACADEDRITRTGRREQHHFKPRPNHSLLLSGTLTTGLWLVRRDVLADPAIVDDRLAAEWAETLRLDLWLRLHAQLGAFDSVRIPYLLVQRRTDVEEAPKAALTAVIDRHFAHTSLPWISVPSWPLGSHPAARGAAPVSVHHHRIDTALGAREAMPAGHSVIDEISEF